MKKIVWQMGWFYYRIRAILWRLKFKLFQVKYHEFIGTCDGCGFLHHTTISVRFWLTQREEREAAEILRSRHKNGECHEEESLYVFHACGVSIFYDYTCPDSI